MTRMWVLAQAPVLMGLRWAALLLLWAVAQRARPLAAALLRAAAPLLRALPALLQSGGQSQEWQTRVGPQPALSPAVLLLPLVAVPLVVLVLPLPLVLLPPLALLALLRLHYLDACQMCPCMPQKSTVDCCYWCAAPGHEKGTLQLLTLPASPSLLCKRQGRLQLGGDLSDVLWRCQHNVAGQGLQGRAENELARRASCRRSGGRRRPPRLLRSAGRADR